MSVTIVSALPKVAAVPADSRAAPEGDGAALDFASLLSGQLAPAPLPTIADPALVSETTANDATASEDAAALFAALGIVVAPAVPVTPPPATAAPAADGTASDALASLASTASASNAAAARTEPSTPLNAASEAASSLPASDADSARTARTEPAIIAANTARAVPEASENAAAAAANAAVAPRQGTTMTSLPTALRDPQWHGDFAQKVVWLAKNDSQFAQLTLNPPQMGPIEISMSIEKGSASASFFSANADVRESIESALPRLREMFANAGIELGQTNVSAESFKQAQTNQDGTPGGARWRGDNAILVADSISAQRGAEGGARGNGIVDIFA